MFKIKTCFSAASSKKRRKKRQWQIVIVPLPFFQESNVLIAANSQGTIKVSYFTHLLFKHLNLLLAKSKVRETIQPGEAIRGGHPNCRSL